MQANSLPIHTLSVPGWGQRVNTKFSSESDHEGNDV